MIRARTGVNSLIIRQFRVQRPQRMPLSSTSFRLNQIEDIEKVKALIEQKMVEIKRTEEKRIEDEKKPKLSDFQRPLMTTFLIASLAYLVLHWGWWYLEYNERESDLKVQLEQKEAELAAVIQGRQTEESKKTSGKSTWFRFWRTN